MLRTRWTPGPAAGAAGPMLVSVTDFRVNRRRDLPGIYQAGLALRRAWPELTGAVGMWLWTTPLAGRCGAVSIWRDGEALHRFVAWPEHVTIMRRYRGRGQVRSTTWSGEFDLATMWAHAKSYLAEEPRATGSDSVAG